MLLFLRSKLAFQIMLMRKSFSLATPGTRKKDLSFVSSASESEVVDSERTIHIYRQITYIRTLMEHHHNKGPQFHFGKQQKQLDLVEGTFSCIVMCMFQHIN